MEEQRRNALVGNTEAEGEVMAEQREPGWFLVRFFAHWRICKHTKDEIYPWEVEQGYKVNDGYWDEIGERIPGNEELKALRAVAEAARDLLEVSGATHKVTYSRERLQDALARLGERE